MKKKEILNEMMKTIMENAVLQISNDIKTGKLNVDDDIVVCTIHTLLNDFEFNFLKQINLAINGSDAEKMGNVNEFIDELEILFLQGEKSMNEFRHSQIHRDSVSSLFDL